jgi:hypothetical protein
MSHRLQVLISEELDTQLSKVANRSRLSKGAWVRRTLESALHAPGMTTDPVAELASLNTPTSDIQVMLAEIEKGRV